MRNGSSNVPRQSHMIRQRGHTVERGDGLQGGETAAEQWAKDGVVEPGGIKPGTVLGGALVPGSLSATPFADTIRPVTIVTALPTLPDPLFPIFSYVVLTTNERLYKNVADVWVLGVNGADIVADSITAGQIAAGAISASEIAAGAVSTEKLAVGSLRANLLVHGDFENPSFGSGVYVNNGAGAAGAFTTWTHAGALIESAASNSIQSKSGLWVGLLRNPTGYLNNQGMYQSIPVRPGRRYRLSGWLWKGVAAGGPARIVAHAYDKTGAVVAFNAIAPPTNSTTTATYVEAFYTAASNVTTLLVYCRWDAPVAAGEIFAFEDVTLEEVPGGLQNGAATTVIDDAGVTVTNGAMTVTNAGATVIIDGTSNLFKIAATGTTSATAVSGGFSIVNTTLVALGALATTPAHNCFVAAGNGVADYQYLSYMLGTNTGFVATTSGGAVTNQVRVLENVTHMRTSLNGSSQCVVQIQVDNDTAASITSYGRYYVFKEAAL